MHVTDFHCVKIDIGCADSGWTVAFPNLLPVKTLTDLQVFAY